MIQVSNEFKTAIKKPERKIKGYVEVLYDLPGMMTMSSSLINSSYTDLSELTNGKRVTNNYGTLDYLPLDGSALAMGTQDNENSGFISDDLFEDIQSPAIAIYWNDQTEIKGMTLYFGKNIPTDLTIYYGDNTQDTISNNDKDVIQIIFDEPKNITQVQVVINDVMYPDRKLYINEIDLGITQVYKNQDLIEFTVDEEVNKLVEEVPINETNITLNNMSNLFNPLNPSGIVPYLSENTLIKPYIGVLTEGLGVEYVKMGEFYFDSYTNNSDATTTLVGKNLMKKLSEEILNDDNEMEFFFGLGKNKTKFLQYMGNYDYNLGTIDWNRDISFMTIKDDKLINLLKDSAFMQNAILYFDRNNNLNMRHMDDNVDALTKYELINDVEYKKISKINTIIATFTYPYQEGEVETKKISETKVILTKSPQTFLVKTNEAMSITSVTQTGGTQASIVDKTLYLVFVKIQGAIGNEITIELYGKVHNAYKDINNTLKSNETENETILEFNSPTLWLQNVPQNKFDMFPSYEMRFDYNGDPSLEAGDYINVETPYGYKPLFIQKNRFKFDGGLEGSIEGVE